MTAANISLLWSHALPLSTAYIQLADKPSRDRHAELQEQTSIFAIAERATDYGDQSKDLALDERLKGLHAAGVLGPMSELEALECKLKDRIIASIKRGLLKAVGYAVPRKPADMPVEVPPDLWAGRVSWERNSVEGNGLRVEAVRVFPASWLKTPAKVQGRPSRQDEIAAAYSELKQAHRIDYASATLASIALQVQAQILAQHPNHPEGLRGVGEKAIQLAIADDVRAEKAARKKL